MVRKWVAACLLAGPCWLLAAFGVISEAHAQAPEPNRVTVWSLNVKKLPKNLRRGVPEELSALVDGAVNWRIVEPDKKQRKALTRLGRRCKPKGSSGCAQQVGQELGVPYVLAARFSGGKKRPKVVLLMFDVEARKEAARVQGRVSPATWRDDVGGLARELLAAPALVASPSEVPSPAASATPELPEPQVPPLQVAATPVEPPATRPDSQLAAPEPSGTRPSTPDAKSAEIAIAEEEGVPVPASATEEIMAKAVKDMPLPGTEPGVTAEAAPTSQRNGIGLSVAAGPLFLLPNSKVHVTGGATLDVLYFLPLFDKPEMQRMLGISFESGWYPLFGHATNEFQEYDQFSEFDPEGSGSAFVTTTYEVDWDIQIVPIYLGAVGRLSTDMLLSLLGLDGFPVAPEVFGRAGVAMAWGKATASLNRPDEEPFVTGNTAEDIGWGFYLGIGGGLALGPGSLTLEYRYTDVRLDFEFPEWNLELGDIGGNLWRLAYRMDF